MRGLFLRKIRVHTNENHRNAVVFLFMRDA